MIGETLKKLRDEKGLTLKQMGEILGVSHMTYQRYEKNDTDVSTEMLSKLADFYGVSADYLLGRTEVREMNTLPKDEPTEEEVKNLENQIVSSYTQMSVETRRACIKALMQIVGDVFLDLQDEDGEEPQDSAG